MSTVANESSTAAPGRDRWTDSSVHFALVGMCVASGAGVLAAIFGASSWVVVLVVLALTILIGLHTVRLYRREQSRFEALWQEESRELANWQRRWQQLQRETQEATSALAQMRDGVIMLSGEAKILMINSAARRLFGISGEADISFRSFAEVVRIPELTQAISAARAGDGTQKLLIEVPQDDRVFPIRVRVDRERTSGNNNLLLTLRDESEAHRLDAMRREFVANISHELKTPLAAIKGYAETVELAIKDDPDAAAHFMKQIHAQCLRLERLVSDMMQLARAQSGRENLNIGAVSLSDAINESLKSYRPIAETKKIDLSFDEPTESPVVLSDSEATLTIVNNLIGNAIRYTPDGGSVSVACRDAGNAWSLVVKDTGVGIAESDQKRIFERFYRVGKGRGTGDGGTGIGLSIVKNLSMTLGGEVRVSSKPGRGAKFEVLLPKSRDSQPAVSETRATTAGESS